jgi:hypothetical protein
VIDPTVRPAQAADVAQLDLLEREARATLVGQRGGARWLETHPEHAGAWPSSSDAGAVHVAHIDDVIVGYLVARYENRIVRIDDVYVTP